MKQLVVCLLVTIVLMTGCQSLGEKVVLTEQVAIKGVENIEVDVSSADVEVIAENRTNILIEFETYENGQQLRVREGKTALIETYNKEIAPFTSGGNYRLTVYIPHEYEEDTTFNLSSGNVKMNDFNIKDLSCDLSSGNLDFRDINAERINLDFSSGDVDFDNVTTELLRVDMSSGDITLENFTGAIKGNSSSGNFTVNYKDAMDDLDFEATSGSINVYYGNIDINGSFNLSKSSGDIDVNIELDEYSEKDDGDHIIGLAGRGKYEVKLDISSGDIDIN